MIFIFVKQRRWKQTRFLNTEISGRGDWLSINTTRIFVGTVPTFKLRILIVENVGSQNFYKQLIVGSTKILTNSLTFWLTHVYKFILILFKNIFLINIKTSTGSPDYKDYLRLQWVRVNKSWFHYSLLCAWCFLA